MSRGRRRWPAWVVAGGAFTFSAVVHAAVCVTVGTRLAAPAASGPRALTLMRDLPVTEPPPEAPPLEPEPLEPEPLEPEPLEPEPLAPSESAQVLEPSAEPPARERGPRRPAGGERLAEAPAPTEPSAGAGAAEPLDLSDLTLTREGVAGWNVPLGDGPTQSGWARADGRRHRGMGTGRGRGRMGAARSAAPARAPRPSSSPAADRSQRPRQPNDIDAHLERHYPVGARDAGREGDGWVRVRIEADGHVGPVLERGGPEIFARACERALRTGPRWTPARDRSGRPHARVIRFRCRFRVR